jgi:hypothetical protein
MEHNVGTILLPTLATMLRQHPANIGGNHKTTPKQQTVQTFA